MNAKIKTAKSLILIAVLALATVLTGCSGGGSIGTGGLRTYEGKLLSESGAPLSGVTVTVSGSDDSDITDAQGEFFIATEVAGEDVALLFESVEFTASVPIEDIPEDADQVELELTFDEESETIEPEEIEFRDDGEEIPTNEENGDDADGESSAGADPVVDDGAEGEGAVQELPSNDDELGGVEEGGIPEEQPAPEDDPVTEDPEEPTPGEEPVEE